jgi:hypothetical protein
MDLQEIGDESVDWIQLAQDMIQFCEEGFCSMGYLLMHAKEAEVQGVPFKMQPSNSHILWYKN